MTATLAHAEVVFNRWVSLISVVNEGEPQCTLDKAMAKEESKYALHDNSGMLRSLYSPRFIEAILIEEIGLPYLTRYLEYDIHNVLSFRTETNVMTDLWKGFQQQLSEIFAGITLLAKYDQKLLSYSDQEIIQYYKNYLLKSDGSNISEILADLAVKTIGQYQEFLKEFKSILK